MGWLDGGGVSSSETLELDSGLSKIGRLQNRARSSLPRGNLGARPESTWPDPEDCRGVTPHDVFERASDDGFPRLVTCFCDNDSGRAGQGKAHSTFVALSPP